MREGSAGAEALVLVSSKSICIKLRIHSFLFLETGLKKAQKAIKVITKMKVSESLTGRVSLVILCLILLCINSGVWVQSAKSNSPTGQSDAPAKLIVQLGHSLEISSAAYSPDGAHVVTGSRDGSARLWEVQTGREIRVFERHSDGVTSVSYSPNGKQLLTGGLDATARIWDVETGRELRSFGGHSQTIWSVAYSPDGKYVLTGSEDKTAKLWEVETGQLVQNLEGHSEAVYSVAYSPDGKFALTGSETTRLWELDGGREVRQFQDYTQRISAGPVRSVAFSADGKQVLTARETARLWETETGKEVRRFEGPRGSVLSIAFSPDGKYVVTGSDAEDLRPGGSRANAGLAPHVAIMWEVETGREVRRFEGHHFPVHSIAFSPDGNSLLTVSDEAFLWETGTGTQLKNFQGHSDKLSQVVYSPGGEQVLSWGLNKKLRIWDLRSGRQVRTFDGHSSFNHALVYSPDGNTVLISMDNAARIWEAETGKEVRRFEGHSGAVSGVAYSPDGCCVLTGSFDRSARIWEIETGREVRRFEGHSDWVVSVAYSTDGKHVLTGSSDGTARVWEARTGKEVRSFDGHLSAVTSAVYSPDGEYVLTGSLDNTARIWSLDTGDEVRRFDNHPNGVDLATYSPNGKNVLTSGGPLENVFASGTVRIWDVESGQEQRRLEGHSNRIVSIDHSPDGKYVLTAGWDNTTRVWEASTGKELCQLISFVDDSWVVVTPDGRFDTDTLEELKGLHWIMPDDPMRALPLEIFMRDYYEPGLLPRILSGEQFKEIRNISTLNRVQPKVEIKAIDRQKNSSDLVTVTVEVAKASSQFRQGEGTVTRQTDVYDLRLFRDGQIVGQTPAPTISANDELLTWRESSQVSLGQSGKQVIKFQNIRLPRRHSLSEVEFTAYAFNEDRVKSQTARKTLAIPKDITPVKGRAYLISVGVNTFENKNWDLQFAANDARSTQQVVSEALRQSRQHEEVIGILLISDAETKESHATKANFNAVLDLLAGKNVDPNLIKAIPNAEKLKEARPEDLVVISFSSHGYADQGGTFYLFPSDIGNQGGTSVDEQIKQKLISSDELSLWLGDVDAGEMVMIVDACHAAAAVEGSEFKPGPMGSRGLGQLSYDKVMRILTATQAANVAIEAGLIGHGLLTYALVKEGLEEHEADFKPKDQAIALKEWLEYGVERVPKLYVELLSGKVPGNSRAELVGSATGQRGYQQQPSLFDFSRKKSEVVLTRISVSDSPQ